MPKFAADSALGKAIDECRRAFCEQALLKARGNTTEAARICGIARQHMHRLILRYEIKVTRPGDQVHPKALDPWNRNIGQRQLKHGLDSSGVAPVPLERVPRAPPLASKEARLAVRRTWLFGRKGIVVDP